MAITIIITGDIAITITGDTTIPTGTTAQDHMGIPADTMVQPFATPNTITMDITGIGDIIASTITIATIQIREDTTAIEVMP